MIRYGKELFAVMLLSSDSKDHLRELFTVKYVYTEIDVRSDFYIPQFYGIYWTSEQSGFDDHA